MQSSQSVSLPADTLPLVLPDTPLQVRKRQGQAVAFDHTKIENALAKAFSAVEGEHVLATARVRDAINAVTCDIQQRLQRRLPEGGLMDIEDIQDQVELGLMRGGFHKIARAYVLYREQRRSERPVLASSEDDTTELSLDDGTTQYLQMADLRDFVNWLVTDLTDADPSLLLTTISSALFSGMKKRDVSTAMILAVRPLIERDPAYSKVCARLLLNALSDEAFTAVNLSSDAALVNHYQPAAYSAFFTRSIKECVESTLLDERVLEFDLPRLAEAIQPERDLQLSYLGMQTLYDRYFLHKKQQRLELPQTFFMRVAMGLAINEDHPTERAIAFYDVLSKFDYMTSTPTLFNAATRRSQLSSCYLTTIPDELEGIYTGIKENALLSKWAGGLGNDWTPVRSLGAHIRGTNGESQGIVPFLKVVNDTAVAVNQGGKRKGAVCAYLETWHLDIEDFLELRKNTGDERRRTHDMNTANWVPDLFMQRVVNDENWTLFSPNDTPDLHDCYGQVFRERYEEYEQQAKQGDLTHHRVIPARQLWRKMLSMLFETGHPWITFKDPCNVRSPQQHVGVVHSSNLCTEITLNTSDQEIAVCNLGSINLVNHIREGKLDEAHLRQTITTAVRMLDNVIDINYYAVEKARKANLQHRPVGLGIMGFQDALYALKIPYASEDAVHFADQSMELISYYALQASCDLAKERGQYPSYAGSLWDQGVLPIDSIKLLAEARGDKYLTMDTTQALDWTGLRDQIKQHGLRNSNVLAIAPTATISNIVGVSQSIEPAYQNLFVKSNLSGEFTVVNTQLVNDLKALDLWDEVMRSDLNYFDGSVQKIDRVPDSLKALYATAFEIDSRWLIEAASRRQKWIDQAQSVNLYLAEASGKKLDSLYQLAWSRGLKTTYYLRSLGATQMEKDAQNKSDIAGDEESRFCSITDPDCEACQ